MIKVFYHYPCNDGSAAAAVAYSYYGTNARYIPMSYDDEFPQVSKGDELVFLDYSIPREKLERLSSYCKITIIDHHKTAQENLEGFQGGPFSSCVFDMTKSGAMLAWEFFYPDVNPPHILNYIQDRDLWTFEFSETNDVFSAFKMLAADDIKQWWVTIYKSSNEKNFLESFIESGSGIRKYNEKLAMDLCRDFQLMNIAGYTVPCVNSSVLFSEIGHNLLILHPEFPFSAVYTHTGKGTIKYSLRGRKSDDFDVSEIAKIYGGGGHKKAAGFSIINFMKPNLGKKEFENA